MKLKEVIPVKYRRMYREQLKTLHSLLKTASKNGKRGVVKAFYSSLRRFGYVLKRKKYTLPVCMDKRLEIFFERLRDSPSASNSDEALLLISRLLEEVEDEYSGVTKSLAPNLEPDGRMYPPQADHIKPNGSGGKIALTRGHVIEITSNGDMTFCSRRERTKVLFRKAGRNT